MRYIELALLTRGVRAKAVMLDDQAPLTCAAMWDALPLEGGVHHARFACNEIYFFAKPWLPEPLPVENPGIALSPGDLSYKYFGPNLYSLAEKGPLKEYWKHHGMVDLAYWYDHRIMPTSSFGMKPRNAYARIVEGFEELRQAGDDVFRRGGANETMRLSRL